MEPANPFPGMNPWLEPRWGDVRAAMTVYAADDLQFRLPSGLRARLTERTFTEAAAAPETDVPAHGSGTGGGGTCVAEPLVIYVSTLEVTESRIDVIDTRAGGSLVTAIEFVSRRNKRGGPGRDFYLRQRQEAVRRGANMVEIDLIRGGRPVTLVPPALVPAAHRTPYHVCVRRAERPDPLEFYPVALRHRLPTVRVPLRPGDPDAALDLQAIVNLAYRKGRYTDVNYADPPEPPLSREDASWARGVLAAVGMGTA